MRISRVTLNYGYTGNNKIHESAPETTFVGMASLQFDGSLSISHLRVLKKADGRIIAKMPSIKTSRGENRQVVYPLTQPITLDIERAILQTIAEIDPESKNRVIVKCFS